ncbi:MAG: PIN domain-containing protein [Armatimonadetes bacterium]|nr:PIN domain-containing protein [Armatimonadota bacterium]
MSGSGSSQPYVLDASALIAYLRQEPGHEIVTRRLTAARKGQEILWMHAVNLCEVYYDALRRSGKALAEQLLMDVGGLPIRVCRTIGRPLLRESGRLKAVGGISLADALAVGLANLKGGRLVTADHHELDAVEQRGDGRFCWIR